MPSPLPAQLGFKEKEKTWKTLEVVGWMAVKVYELHVTRLDYPQ